MKTLCVLFLKMNTCSVTRSIVYVDDVSQHWLAETEVILTVYKQIGPFSNRRRLKIEFFRFFFQHTLKFYGEQKRRPS